MTYAVDSIVSAQPPGYGDNAAHTSALPRQCLTPPEVLQVDRLCRFIAQAVKKNYRRSSSVLIRSYRR